MKAREDQLWLVTVTVQPRCKVEMWHFKSKTRVSKRSGCTNEKFQTLLYFQNKNPMMKAFWRQMGWWSRLHSSLGIRPYIFYLSISLF